MKWFILVYKRMVLRLDSLHQTSQSFSWYLNPCLFSWCHFEIQIKRCKVQLHFCVVIFILNRDEDILYWLVLAICNSTFIWDKRKSFYDRHSHHLWINVLNKTTVLFQTTQLIRNCVNNRYKKPIFYSTERYLYIISIYRRY